MLFASYVYFHYSLRELTIDNIFSEKQIFNLKNFQFQKYMECLLHQCLIHILIKHSFENDLFE